MAYDNRGRGALWANEHHDQTGKGPLYKGNIVADRAIAEGEEIPLAVFRAEKKTDRSPDLRISIDRWKEQNPKRGEKSKVPPQTMRANEAPPDSFDDQEIPF
jgi:hypothetical protein